MMQWQKKKKSKENKTQTKPNQTKKTQTKIPHQNKTKKRVYLLGFIWNIKPGFVFFPQKDGILHTFIGAH